MDVFRIAGIAVMTAVLAATVRTYRPEMGLHIAVAGGLILLAYAAAELAGVAQAARSMLSDAGVDGDVTSLVMKVVGVAFIAQTAADVCRDSGENSLAGKVELCGRLMMVQASLPLLVKLQQIVAGLLEKRP